MLTPEEEYMIKINSLKYTEELLAMVELLTADLEGVITMHNDSGEPEDTKLDYDSVHNAQMLLKDIKGEVVINSATSEKVGVKGVLSGQDKY